MNTSSDQISAPWLAYFPPTLFGSVLGITGLGLAWRRAESNFGWSPMPSDLILIIGGIVLVLVLICMARKSLSTGVRSRLMFCI